MAGYETELKIDKGLIHDFTVMFENYLKHINYQIPELSSNKEKRIEQLDEWIVMHYPKIPDIDRVIRYFIRDRSFEELSVSGGSYVDGELSISGIPLDPQTATTLLYYCRYRFECKLEYERFGTLVRALAKKHYDKEDKKILLILDWNDKNDPYKAHILPIEHMLYILRNYD